MKLLDLQEQRLQQSTSTSDMEHLSRSSFGGGVKLSGGPVSEPTTPPDYSDAGFPTSFSRPNRFSIHSVNSPPGLNNRFSQSSSQLASPSGTVNGRNLPQKPPAKSMPGSRRNSEDDEYLPEEVVAYRAAAA
jgi:hypothetical protein